MRKGKQSKDVDRISGLPGNIIDTILSCLPLSDAARTSVLSRKWRHNFLNVPKLVFNDSLLRKSIRNQPSAGQTLISVIYQVLLLHRGRITEFELSLPEVKSYSDIDRFMNYLSGNCVEIINISILGDEIYKLPSTLYSCLQLKDLILEYCIFKPPTGFRGFRRLTGLVFYSVIFDSEEFGSFVSKCVLLESLTIVNEVAYQSFIIDAPKLKYLHLDGILNPIRFKRAPLLEVLEIFPQENGEASAVKLKQGEVSNFELLRLPIIEDMMMNNLFLKSLAAGSVPVKHLNISLPLKVLEITDICFSELDEVSCFLNIIRSSTKLKKYFYSAQDYSDIRLDQLQEVKIECVKGSKVEMEFIKLLLATSTILEEILIVPDLQNVADKGLMMSKKLLQFERASRKAKITIEDP